MKKQSGRTAADLWIAYWLAAKSGRTAESLLASLDKSGGWGSVIASLRLPERSVEKQFVSESKNGAFPERLAGIVVDDALISRRLMQEPVLAGLRTERASDQDVIITALVSLKTGRPASQVYGQVKRRIKSWGALLQETKIHPDTIQEEYARLLK